MVDGVTIDSKCYVVNGGHVYLTRTYLNTLTNGKHTVKLDNGDKSATTTITVRKAPL